MSQQARNFLMDAEDMGLVPKIVMRDNDTKFTAQFDAVLESADVEVKRNTPLSPPKIKLDAPSANHIVTAAVRFTGDSRLPLPGTILTREYKGQTVQVRVLANGFEYAGEVFRSLSAVAKAVTGPHTNGFHFFRLRTGDR